MTTQATLSRAQQFVDDLNRGDADSMQRYLTAEFFAHTPEQDEPTQYDVYRDLFKDLRAAFPDLEIALSDLQRDGDLLRGQVVVKGTHDGPLWGAPASGEAVEWPVEIALRPVGERFAVSLENVSVPALLTVLRQIELVPAADKMDRPHKYPFIVPDVVLKVMYTGQMADKPCRHLDEIQVTETTIEVCEQCVASGDIWPALRLCLTCGFVGCCDTSKNKMPRSIMRKRGIR